MEQRLAEGEEFEPPAPEGATAFKTVVMVFVPHNPYYRSHVRWWLDRYGGTSVDPWVFLHPEGHPGGCWEAPSVIMWSSFNSP